MKQVLMIFALAALLVGCGAPTFDASSKQDLEESVAEMKAAMESDAEKKKLDESLKALAMNIGLKNRKELESLSQAETGELMLEKTNSAYGGMEANEIYEAAEIAMAENEQLLKDAMGEAMRNAMGQ